MNLKKLIINELKSGKELSVKEISDKFGFSRQIIHRILGELLSQKIVVKIGSSPKVYYKLANKEKTQSLENISSESLDFLEKYFMYVTPLGLKKQGIEAFSIWCEMQHLPLEKTVLEFIETRTKYLKFYDKNNFGN